MRTRGGGMVDLGCPCGHAGGEGDLLAEARRRETWWSAATGSVCVGPTAQLLFSILSIPVSL